MDLSLLLPAELRGRVNEYLRPQLPKDLQMAIQQAVLYRHDRLEKTRQLAFLLNEQLVFHNGLMMVDFQSVDLFLYVNEENHGCGTSHRRWSIFRRR